MGQGCECRGYPCIWCWRCWVSLSTQYNGYTLSLLAIPLQVPIIMGHCRASGRHVNTIPSKQEAYRETVSCTEEAMYRCIRIVRVKEGRHSGERGKHIRESGSVSRKVLVVNLVPLLLASSPPSGKNDDGEIRTHAPEDQWVKDDKDRP